MYSITTDLPRNQVSVEFTGTFEHSSEEFMRDFKEAVGQVKGSDGRWNKLADFSQTIILDPDRFKRGQELYYWMEANGLRKGASVVGEALMSLQLKRMASGDEKYRYFTARQEAQIWLDS